ncbi:MAG: amino acid ABC transporter substrate-binding protein [Chloroflexi bacterium]|nr:amino acid ABC transporter substrate-binding protein [Chloroflexota bacterium]
MRTRWLLIGIGLLAAILAIAAVACGDDDDDDDNGDTPANGEEPANGAQVGDTLGDVVARGELVCGVNDAVPGFGFLEADGTSSGFDVDFCRALAAAVLGDADAVEYVILTAAARFEALSSGQIDVLIRNTTWTLSRDADLKATFATTTFYDGQGMMVRVADGISSIDDMAGTTVCVLQGTTTELNLADRFASGGLDYTPLTFEENGPLEAAFTAEACDGWTSDKSQLAARRFAYAEADGGPESLVILDETFSKEPLGPVTRDGDTQWSDIVNWVVIGMITADEKGITSQNLADFVADPGNAETARLLGVSFEGGEIFDSNLGIDADFMQDVIGQVGNYDEVYTKNIEPLGIPRAGTLNASWLNGGLIYAPPTR